MVQDVEHTLLLIIVCGWVLSRSLKYLHCEDSMSTGNQKHPTLHTIWWMWMNRLHGQTYSFAAAKWQYLHITGLYLQGMSDIGLGNELCEYFLALSRNWSPYYWQLCFKAMFHIVVCQDASIETAIDELSSRSDESSRGKFLPVPQQLLLFKAQGSFCIKVNKQTVTVGEVGSFAEAVEFL